MFDFEDFGGIGEDLEVLRVCLTQPVGEARCNRMLNPLRPAFVPRARPEERAS